MKSLALMMALALGLGQAAASPTLTDGEVRKIDKDTRKVTLKHAEIKNLDMPPMTMVFQLKDPAWADKLKVGSKVRFAAENTASGMVVTELQVMP